MHSNIRLLVWVNGLGLVNAETYLSAALVNENGNDLLNRPISRSMIKALGLWFGEDLQLIPSVYEKIGSDPILLDSLLAMADILVTRDPSICGLTLPSQITKIILFFDERTSADKLYCNVPGLSS